MGKLPIARSLAQTIIRKGSAFLVRQKLNTLPTTVLVYQMGKVGSSSVHQSIGAVYPGYCFQIHRFSNHHRYIGEVYRQYYKNKIPLKIISMVREPIERNVSGFFQTFKKTTGTEFQKDKVDMEDLMASFLEKFNHQLPLKWFDKNIYKHFNIDVFNREFPERGYDIFVRGNIELLLFKHDLPDAQKEQLISEFLDLEDFSIIRTNISSQKEYASTYQKFKQIPLPHSYIDEMLDSRYARHFYGNELKGLKDKWKKAADTPKDI
ncbi:putative capsular polysaccharide synthesis family protein [Flagellimonas marinaquae]